MPFDLTSWRRTVQQDIEHFALNPVESFQQAGVTTLYGFLFGSAILPVVAAYAIDPHSALMTLLGIVGGVGSNLAANWIQSKHDKLGIYAVAVEEARQPELAPIYDAIAQQVGVFFLANQVLRQAGQTMMIEQLQAELKRAGKFEQYLNEPPSIQQMGTFNVGHTTNYGPSIGNVSGGGPMFIATNQVISNMHINSPTHTSAASPFNQSQPLDETEHKQVLLKNFMRRVQILQQQAARYGIATPPEVTIEIEDLTHQINQLQSELHKT